LLPKIKICGITNLEDALDSIDAGADALGFVFYEKSPRYISPQKTAEIIDKLPPFIEKVGLFVNQDSDIINKLARESKITLVQLHFEIDNIEKNKIEIPNIRVIRASTKDDLNNYQNEFCFVDAFVDEFGGIGKRLNLDWFKNRDNSKTIIAGGLNSENISELNGFGFFGFDISSGVEEQKGKKSKEKVIDFIQKAKNTI